MDNQENSGVNTVLIVIILVIIVAGLVWFFAGRGPAAEAPNNDAGFQVDVNIPDGNGGSDTNTDES
jgi:uncharacterized membrane protein YqiK